MRVFISLPLLSSAFLLSCGSPTELEERENQSSQQALDQYDTNSDGILSEKERTTMNSKFVENFDTDGDGKLGVKEREEIRKKAKVTVTPALPSETKNPATAENLFRRIDTNQDGKVDEAEAGETRWKVLQRADKDGDGAVTPEEWGARNE